MLGMGPGPDDSEVRPLGPVSAERSGWGAEVQAPVELCVRMATPNGAAAPLARLGA